MCVAEKCICSHNIFSCIFSCLLELCIFGYCPYDKLQALVSQPSSWFLANMSVFRSLPDAWAIGQLFPILPLHRLAEAPTILGSIADLTCDSDGCIDKFVGPATSVSSRYAGQPALSLPLHRTRESETYLVGAFLVGSYQDSMGSRGHNLFGSPAVARVFISGGPAESVLRKVDFRASETHFKRDNFYVSVKSGQSTADVLQDFGVESDELLEWMKDNTPRQSVATKQLLSTYERILGTQTYLESF